MVNDTATLIKYTNALYDSGVISIADRNRHTDRILGVSNSFVIKKNSMFDTNNAVKKVKSELPDIRSLPGYFTLSEMLEMLGHKWMVTHMAPFGKVVANEYRAKYGKSPIEVRVIGNGGKAQKAYTEEHSSIIIDAINRYLEK